MPERQSGRLTITSIDLFCDSDRIVHEFNIVCIVFKNNSYFEPVTLGLENPCSIQLSYGTLVIPERFELSTPGLKDQCSNHLSYEILFVILEGLEPSTFGVVNQRSIQLNCKIIFCNPRRVRTFNLRRIRPMLQLIEL